MARHCPNCGENDLPEKARFCHICGVELAVGLEDEATVHMPGAATINDDGSTRFLLGAEATPEVGAPDAGPADNEQTNSRLEAERIDDDGSTRFIPDASATEDAQTRPGLEAEAMDDDDSTRLMFETESTGDDGQTVAMPDAGSADDDGLTRATPGAGSADDDGQTKAIPDAAIAAAPGRRETEPEPDVTTIAPTDLKTGQILQGRYRLEKMLGKGGFGAVYLTEDLKLKRRCVVKRMLTRQRSSRAIRIYRANFEREANVLVQLNHPGHPGIPEIYDYFTDESGNYLVMKYIEGRNLKAVLDHSEDKIPWREAVRYAVDVCSALNYMHTRGQEPMMHRDVKPANIRLGDDGRVWLVDFGLAKADPIENVGDPMATRASGSVGYSPLEQWFGRAVPASDIYALGATLHHLLTNVSPLKAFAGEFHIKKLKEMHGQFPSIHKFDRKLPKGLGKIVSRATAAEPDQRPTALQLQQQLEILITGAQKAALFTFKNGKSAKTVAQLVDLCEQNRREAEEYLHNGDFERWFLLINRNDLAEAATRAIKPGRNRKDGLEKFLKLIMPNLLIRRLAKSGTQLTRLALQLILVFVVVVLLVAVGGSYVAGVIIQQAIGGTDWDYSELDLEEENYYTELFLAEKFSEAAGPYLDDVQVEMRAPDKIDFMASWNGFPLDVSTSLRLADKKPRLYVIGVYDIPLKFIANNYISQGINKGFDDAFQKGSVDVSSLRVRDKEVVFKVEPSGRAPVATPTPTLTPTPTPTATPTPASSTLVIAFNELDQDIILEIESRTWNIAARDTQVIEIPPGSYNFTVRYRETEEIVAQGTRTWTLNQAYRLRIGVSGQE